MLLLIYLVALPLLLILPIKKKYRFSIPARFFLYRNRPFHNKKVWFHACSFGETTALKPIIDQLNESVNISTITYTGFQKAKSYKAHVRFLPFEIFLPFWVREPKTLVVMEAELWHNLFYFVKAKKILINARISDRSYKSYKRFKFLYRHIFKHIDVVFAQSQEDKTRLMELGATNVKVSGNIKFATNFEVTRRFNKPERQVITAGSTHQNEEKLILEAFRSAKEAMLIVVPRHPERFLEVRKLCETFASTYSYSFSCFSETKALQSDIVLVDALGELINIYAISDVVILGGAFEKIGGHNPLEPAYFKNKIISGAHYFNQKETFRGVQNIYITQAQELHKLLANTHNLQPSRITTDVNLEEIIEEIQHGKSL